MPATRRKPDLSPSRYHFRWLDEHAPKLAFKGGDVKRWQARLRAKLKALLKLPAGPRCALKPRTLWSREHELGRIEKIVFASEPGADVPAYVCTPRNAKPPYAWFICLQGHSTGMHNSIAVDREDETKPLAVEGDRDFALGCLSRGVAALCIEQRSFGERRELALAAPPKQQCHQAAMSSLILGRVLMGERVHDIDRGLDYLWSRKDVDRAKVGVMGNSGGGTASIYSAAVLPRLQFAMPSCSFCTYREAWMSIHHCACSYVPGILEWGEYADVLGLLAPRPCVVVVGKTDGISPIQAVHKGFRAARRVWKAFGAERNLHLVVGPEGHRFYADLAWPKMLKQLGRRG
ncbi:MAG: hypothetical protein M5U26_01600 [Planctomycetota bacterium]|nr:hypothetical protein [Planctomycetota bacterium]